MSFSYVASSSHVTAPASPNAPRFLDGKNENAAIVPSTPARRPSYSAPTACAASSTTARLCFAAMRLISSIAAHWPYRCTGMIAFVHERDARLDLLRIDVVVGEIDVDEHRRRAEAVDHAGGGEERIRGDDDLVARPDAENHQRDQQRVGAGRKSDRVLALAIRGEVALELIDALARG